MPDAPHLLEVLLATVGAHALRGVRAVLAGLARAGHRRAVRVRAGRVRLRQARVEQGLVERDRVHLDLEDLDLEDLVQVLEGRVLVMALAGTFVVAVLGAGLAEPRAVVAPRQRGRKAAVDR